ncbi:hypothetical protein Ciccas_002976 [Cichlidogyrus casuarinus]|uniref:Uncharacterized protein n=1 Tax=Cichlidogyrus casuarinus TaxID=1844966 RepID=A0ABD2QFN9_9PLAT
MLFSCASERSTQASNFTEVYTVKYLYQLWKTRKMVHPEQHREIDIKSSPAQWKYFFSFVLLALPLSTGFMLIRLVDSEWILQSSQMKSRITPSLYIAPEQMAIFCHVFAMVILILVPKLEYILGKINMPKKIAIYLE